MSFPIEHCILWFMIFIALTGFLLGIRKKDILFMAVMVFMVFFSLWCLKNGHRIGGVSEPVQTAKAVRI